MFPKFLTQGKSGPGPALLAIPAPRALPIIPNRIALTSPIPLTQNLRQVLGPTTQPVGHPVPFPAWLGQSRPTRMSPVHHSPGHLNQLAQSFKPSAAAKPLIGLPIFPSVKQEISRIRAEAQAWRLAARSRTGLLGMPLQTLPGARPVARGMTPPSPPKPPPQTRPTVTVLVPSVVTPPASVPSRPLADLKAPNQPSALPQQARPSVIAPPASVPSKPLVDLKAPNQPPALPQQARPSVIAPPASVPSKPLVELKAPNQLLQVQSKPSLELKPQVEPKAVKDGQSVAAAPPAKVPQSVPVEPTPKLVGPEMKAQKPEAARPNTEEAVGPRSESKVDNKNERDNSQISGVASTAASDRVRPQIEFLRRRDDLQTPEFAAAGLESLAQFGQGQGQGGGQQQRRQQQHEEPEENEESQDNDGQVDRRTVDLRLEFDWLAAQDNLLAFSSELREATYGLRERPAASISLEDFHPGPKDLVTPAQAAGEKSGSSLEQRGRHGVA